MGKALDTLHPGVFRDPEEMTRWINGISDLEKPGALKLVAPKTMDPIVAKALAVRMVNEVMDGQLMRELMASPEVYKALWEAIVARTQGLGGPKYKELSSAGLKVYHIWLEGFIGNVNMSSETRDRFVDGPGMAGAIAAKQNWLTPEQIERLLKHPDPEVQLALVFNKSLSIPDRVRAVTDYVASVVLFNRLRSDGQEAIPFEIGKTIIGPAQALPISLSFAGRQLDTWVAEARKEVEADEDIRGWWEYYAKYNPAHKKHEEWQYYASNPRLRQALGREGVKPFLLDTDKEIRLMAAKFLGEMGGQARGEISGENGEHGQTSKNRQI